MLKSNTEPHAFLPLIGPSSLLSRVQIVFMNLFDSKAVESVITERDGLLEGDCMGKIIIDTTTNHFESVTSFHVMFRERDASYLECLVLGSILPALQGNLPPISHLP